MSPESFHRPDFNPNDGLPPTERLTRCAICKQPNCTDASHRPEGERAPEQESPSWPGLKERELGLAHWEDLPQKSEWEDLRNDDGTSYYLDWTPPLVVKVTWEPTTPFEKTEEEDRIVYTDPEDKQLGSLISNVLAPDGTIIVAQSDLSVRSGGGTLRIALNGTRERLRNPEGKSVSAYTCTPDGSVIVKQWEESGLLRIGPDGTRSKMEDRHRLYSPTSSPDGSLYVARDDLTVLRVLPDGKMSVLKNMGTEGMSEAVSVGPDGTLVIGLSNNNVVRVLPDGKTAMLKDPEGLKLQHVQCTSDGSIFVRREDNTFLRIRPDGTASVLADQEQNKLSMPIITPNNELIVTAGSKLFVYLPEKQATPPAPETRPIARKF